MKKLIIVIIVLIFGKGYTQNNIQKYYYFVNKAELEICNDNFPKASKYYKNAFKYNCNPFSSDVLKAFEIEYGISNNDKILEKYAALLAIRGYVMDEVLQDYGTTNNHYFSIVKSVWDTTKIIIDKNLCRLIDSLVEKDQEVRNSECFFQGNDSCIKLGVKTDSSNIEYLYQLCKRNKMDENNVGIHFYNAFIILRHNSYYPECESLKKLLKLLELQTLAGNFNPRKYTFYEDDYYCMRSKDSAKYGSGTSNNYFITGDSSLYFSYPKNLKEINRNRRKFFLEPFNDMIKKIIFQYKNFNKGDFRFYFYTVMKVNGLDNEIINKFFNARKFKIVNIKNDTNIK
jgi:hypothetical protein